MQLMKEGGKWELYIPSELAYGDRGAGTFFILLTHGSVCNLIRINTFSFESSINIPPCYVQLSYSWFRQVG